MFKQINLIKYKDRNMMNKKVGLFHHHGFKSYYNSFQFPGFIRNTSRNYSCILSYFCPTTIHKSFINMLFTLYIRISSFRRVLNWCNCVLYIWGVSVCEQLLLLLISVHNSKLFTLQYNVFPLPTCVVFLKHIFTYRFHKIFT